MQIEREVEKLRRQVRESEQSLPNDGGDGEESKQAKELRGKSNLLRKVQKYGGEFELLLFCRRVIGVSFVDILYSYIVFNVAMELPMPMVYMLLFNARFIRSSITQKSLFHHYTSLISTFR